MRISNIPLSDRITKQGISWSAISLESVTRPRPLFEQTTSRNIQNIVTTAQWERGPRTRECLHEGKIAFRFVLRSSNLMILQSGPTPQPTSVQFGEHRLYVSWRYPYTARRKRSPLCLQTRWPRSSALGRSFSDL